MSQTVNECCDEAWASEFSLAAEASGSACVQSNAGGSDSETYVVVSPALQQIFMHDPNLLKVRHGHSERNFEDGCGLWSFGRLHPQYRSSCIAARLLRRKLHAFCDNNNLDAKCKAAFLCHRGKLLESPFDLDTVKTGRALVASWLSQNGRNASVAVAPHQPGSRDDARASRHTPGRLGGELEA